MSRVGSEMDRMEASGKEFFNKVRQGYLDIAASEPERVKVIDAKRSVSEISREVVQIVSEMM